MQVMPAKQLATTPLSYTHTHTPPALMALLPLVMVAYVFLFLSASCRSLRTAPLRAANVAPAYQIEGTAWCLPATSVKSRPAQLSVSIPAVLSPIRLGRTSAMGSPLASQRATPNGAEVARG
jgi:hypothetical protein